MWILEIEAIAWDGSIVQLQRSLDQKEGEHPYTILTGLKKDERKIFRKWGEADSWDEAVANFNKAITETMQRDSN